MIWVAWRQHRQQTLAGFGLLALIALFLLLTGLQMSHNFHSSGLASCMTSGSILDRTRDCGDLADAFMSRFGAEQVFAILFIVLPVLAGLFWGAPLVAREFEHGTQRFAWMQSITRRKWLSWKVGFVGLATAVAAGALAFFVTWWVSPLLAVTGFRNNSGAAGFKPGLFDLHGIVPLGYALFAFALGLVLGQVIGKVLPAMGATLMGYTAVRVIVELVARPHYMAAKTADLPFFGPDAHGWVIKAYGIDSFGRIFPVNGIDPGAESYLRSRCPGFQLPGPGQFPTKGSMSACFQKIGLHNVEVYQPASRYWTFQWIEFSIFAALACGLIAFAIWRIKKAR